MGHSMKKTICKKIRDIKRLLSNPSDKTKEFLFKKLQILENEDLCNKTRPKIIDKYRKVRFLERVKTKRYIRRILTENTKYGCNFGKNKKTLALAMKDYEFILNYPEDKKIKSILDPANEVIQFHREELKHQIS